MRSRGFTLIELMVTIAIAAILLLVAAPSFMQARRNAELSDATGNFVAAAGSARAAALKTGRDAFVQVLDSGTGWASGWIVYVDNNWNEQYDEGTDEIVLRGEALPPAIAVSAPAGTTLGGGYIRYVGSGFPRSKSTPAATVGASMTMSVQNRTARVTLDPGGRVRTCLTHVPGC